MQQLFQCADAVLRCQTVTPDFKSANRRLVWVVIAFGLLYGAIMGSFGLSSLDRWEQVVYSSVKVPLLLFATFAISLPSFYVLNVLMGLGSDFKHVVRAIVATQAGIAVILAALSPYTLLWYATSSRYASAVGWNAFVFAFASFTGQWLMRKNYAKLIQKNAKHRIMVWIWIAVYALVGIQMGWILRPFIGSPGSEIEFIRVQEWTNAYIVIARLCWVLIVG